MRRRSAFNFRGSSNVFDKAIGRRLLIVAVVLSYCVGAVQADVFNMGTGLTSLDMVWVGNAHNPGDGIYGRVDYVYQIGKYEVTNAQYCEFLNAKAATDTYGLYSAGMSLSARGGINRSGSSGSYSYTVKAGYENMPVTCVSWYNSIRFANWLQNGQGSGDTESGTYQITGGGYNSGTVAIPDAETRATWTAANRHWALPSESEWYKAAYHVVINGIDYYARYPTVSNVEPHSDNPASLAYPTNSGNFCRNDLVANGYDDGYAITGSTTWDDSQNYLTDVGAYTQSSSFYGTFDQGGNVWEWNESLVDSSSRGQRGGCWDWPSDCLLATQRKSNSPTWGSDCSGFRVACVPEPGGLAMLLCFVVTACFCWWRKRG